MNKYQELEVKSEIQCCKSPAVEASFERFEGGCSKLTAFDFAATE